MTFRYRVDRVVKGNLPREVEVRRTYEGGPCGPLTTPGAELGRRVGVLVYPRSAGSPGDNFSTVDPGLLDNAAKSLRRLRPDPRAGQAALVVAGRLHEARLMTVDDQGRIASFGRGGRVLAMSVCPGQRRVVTLEVKGEGGPYPSRTLVVRSVDGLRRLRTDKLAPLVEGNFPPGKAPQWSQPLVSCRSGSGHDVVLYGNDDTYGHEGVEEADLPLSFRTMGHLVRVTNGVQTSVYRGQAGPVAFSRSEEAAYVISGQDGTELYRVDLTGGGRVKVGRVGRSPTSMSLSPDDALVATTAAGRGNRSATSTVVLTGLHQHRTRETSVPNAAGDRPQAAAVWLDTRRFVLPGKTGAVYDDALRVVDTIVGLPERGYWAVSGNDLFTSSYAPAHGYHIAATSVSSGEQRIVAAYGDDFILFEPIAALDRPPRSAPTTALGLALVMLLLALSGAVTLSAVRRRRRSTAAG